MNKKTEGKGPEGSVAGIVGKDGCTLPPLGPQHVPTSILTPERLAAARDFAAKQSEIASGRMVVGSRLLEDAEITQLEYTAKPDPERPGYQTNGLPIVDPDADSEVVMGVRYRGANRPSLRGGRVMKRFSRQAGEKNKVVSVVRVYDPKSTTELRFDGEAECVHWNTTGQCADYRHRHSVRRNVEVEATEERRVF